MAKSPKTHTHRQPHRHGCENHQHGNHWQLRWLRRYQHHNDSHERWARKTHLKHRREWTKKIGRMALSTIIGMALCIIVIALIAPNTFLNHLTGKKMLDGDIELHPTANRHLKLDYDGIDVSHHQGAIDWQRVACDTCVKFVYIKATEEQTIIDTNYIENVNQALKAGIAIGSYHFLTSKSSVREQFKNFYSVVDRRKQTVVPMIDVEQEGVRGWSRQQIQDSLELMAQLIEKHYYNQPIIYSYAHFYNTNLAPRFNQYRLFLARYNMNEPIISGIGQPTIWQHSDQGIVDGIAIPVDLDVFGQNTNLKDIIMKHRPNKEN